MGYAATRSPSEVARRPDDSAFVDMGFLRFAGWPVQLPGRRFPLNTRTMAHPGSASGTIRAIGSS